ncbi:MAG: ABC transporter permease subunit [Symbiobacteriaceae bacterium]|nr:ABC transporter permease subunit [Symbiobacteriaceae bacterium]
MSPSGVESEVAMIATQVRAVQMPEIAFTPVSALELPYSQRDAKIAVSIPRYTLPVTLFWGCVFILVIVSFLSLKLDFAKIFSRVGNLGGVVSKLSHLTSDKLDVAIGALMESVTVTILATVYGLMIGLIVGGLAAENITPWKPLAAILQSFFSLLRAVPTMIWALLVLVCLGFSPATGIVGMLFHVVAFFGRAFAQSFEEVPQATIEALLACGANRLQIFFSAIIPASLTSLIAWTALRFEVNFSESSILGMVGAGGIGYTIMASMSSYQMERAGTAILMVFVFAFSLELLLTSVKRKLKV